MALIKEIETPYGINATYWKITSYRFNVVMQMFPPINQNISNFVADPLIGLTNVEVCGWDTLENRSSLKCPLRTMSYISEEEFNSKTDMYNFLKLQAEFEGATDA